MLQIYTGTVYTGTGASELPSIGVPRYFLAHLRSVLCLWEVEAMRMNLFREKYDGYKSLPVYIRVDDIVEEDIKRGHPSPTRVLISWHSSLHFKLAGGCLTPNY
jgi:hypothetical protein